MQKYVRLGLCTFSYDSKQDKDTYFDKDALLTKCLTNCKTAINTSCKTNNTIIFAHVPYNENPRQYLTIAGYNKHAFFGLFDSISERIGFEDNNNEIINLSDDFINLLEQRFINELNNPNNIPNTVMHNAWLKTIPLLDQVIDLEESLNNLSEEKQSQIRRSLKIDDQITQLVNEYENGNISIGNDYTIT